MSVDPEKVKGPLQLEERQGYRDESVIGGIGPFVRRWCEQSRPAADSQSHEALDRLAALFRGYGELDAAARRQRVQQAHAILDSLTADGERQPKADAPSQRPRAQQSGTPIRRLWGVSDHRAALLRNLGIQTVEQLLRHFPRRYQDRRHLKRIADLREGQYACVLGEVIGQGRTIPGASGRAYTIVPFRDETGAIYLGWWNQRFRETQFKHGARLLVSGTVKEYYRNLSIQVDEYEPLRERDPVHVGRIAPIYPLTEGIHQTQMRSLIYRAVAEHAGRVTEALPPAIRTKRNLVDAQQAIRDVHFPPDDQAKEHARRRVVYEELFLLQVQLAQRRRTIKAEPGIAFTASQEDLEAFTTTLPFELTRAQKRALEEIRKDMASPQPMNRLLHGDVGSGKTVVAAGALLLAAADGYQGAMMAPTELLAEQHLGVLDDLLAPMGLRVALLTSSVTGAARSRLLEEVAAGEVDVVVGTHALIEETVDFARLGLAVVDEQHRFGVLQRARLQEKAESPDVLVMSATPIPRTMALAVYGDLDISVLDELPPGRKPVATEVKTMAQARSAYEFVRTQLAQGHQAFVVCPLVEESERLEVKAARETARRLQRDIFPEYRVGLLHGRMGAAEREAVIGAFRRGEMDVLTATTVIEVGVDIPRANVMLVENAERFGLAQLHQLRGRVGRGQAQAHCILLCGKQSGEAFERLQILQRTQSGFDVAEEDLKIRGPGEFMGTRQHGLPDLKMADIMGDVNTLVEAREDAFELIEQDPDLSRPEHALLRKALQERIREQEKRLLRVS
jgi:ATP-dependent DNA helicase RecG